MKAGAPEQPWLGPGRDLSRQEAENALDALHMISGILLFEFARESRALRDVILRNLVARADSLTTAVFALWDLEDPQDCWVLHRCLLDRYFHLAHLAATDSFETFERWSFLEQYKALDRVKADPSVDTSRDDLFVPLSPEQKRRAKTLLKAPPKWQRPRAETVAKQLGMKFLYTYGYNHASAWVHPMADDGDQDFYRITGLEPAPFVPDQRTVLANTLLVDTLVLQDAMNASTVSWMALVYDVVVGIREYLATGDMATFLPNLTLLSEAFKRGQHLSESPVSKSGE